MMRAIIIPVKEPTQAKQRLSRLLDSRERMSLAWAMFEDVTESIGRYVSHRGDGEVDVFLVTNYRRAAQRAAWFGWDVFHEDRQDSESASVDWASDLLKQRGFDAVLRLPADIPLLQPENIEGLLGLTLEPPAALLVPSRNGKGTNALLRYPADLFPSHFGPDSLSLHSREAHRVGASCRALDIANISLDIDDPDDIVELMKHKFVTRTQRLLADWGIWKRLAMHGFP